MLHRFTIFSLLPKWYKPISSPPPQVAEITMVDFGVRPMDADEELKVSLIKWFYKERSLILLFIVPCVVYCVLCSSFPTLLNVIFCKLIGFNPIRSLLFGIHFKNLFFERSYVNATAALTRKTPPPVIPGMSSPLNGG